MVPRVMFLMGSVMAFAKKKAMITAITRPMMRDLMIMENKTNDSDCISERSSLM